MTAPFGMRRLAAAFPKASLLATGYSFSAASELAGAKRQHAAALQSSRTREEVLDAPHSRRYPFLKLATINNAPHYPPN